MDIERLKKRKKELGWTHDELAERSGISRTTIARLFSGNPDYPSPTYNTVQAIERALGLDRPAWTDEDEALGVGDHPARLSADEWEWLELRSQIIEAMGEDYLSTLIKLLQGIAKKKS